MTTSLSDFARDLAADTRSFVVDYVGKAIAGMGDQLGQRFELRFASIKDGRDGRDGKDADPALIESLKGEVAALRIEIAELRAQPKSAPLDPGAIAALLTDAVKALPAARDGRDGKDGASVDRADVEAMVKSAVAALPVPKDGRDGVSVDLEDVELLVKRAVSALPAPKDGRDGASVDRFELLAMVKAVVDELPKPRDGKDGTSVYVGDVLPVIEALVAEIPRPKDGRDGTDGKSIERGDVLEMVKVVVSELPVPKDGRDGQDGRSLTADDVQPLVEALVTKAVSAIPSAKDGVGLQDAVIDRDGVLVLTFTDGRTKTVGTVVGADVDPEHVKRVIGDAIAAFPRPKDGADGKDGLGFDDMDLFFDDQKGCAVVRLSRGAHVKEYDLPWWAHRGTFQAGTRYRKGHHVVSRGSTFCCVEDTTDRPGDGTSKAWRLVASRGKDGKDGKDAVSE